MKYTVLLAATLVLASCSSEPESLTIPATAIEPMAEATANAEASLFISGMTCEVGCKGISESKLGKSHCEFRDHWDSTLVFTIQLW